MKNAILGLVTFLTLACAPEMILESKDVQFLKVDEINSGTSKQLKISGLVLHSAWAVSEVTQSQKDDSLHILVHLVRAREGLSGNLSYETVIPPAVSVVRFGNQKTIIWSRH